MRRTAAALGLSLAALGACGIDVTGTYVPDGGALLDADGGLVDAAPAGDAGDASEPATDSGPAPPVGCSCAVTAPAGFSLVAFETDPKGKCVGDLTTEDRVANPTLNGAGCSCGPCTVTTPPSCETGNFSVLFDNNVSMSNNTCDDNSQTLTKAANNGTCIQQGDPTFPYHGKVVDAPLTAGTCASAATPNPKAGAGTPVRVCATVANGKTCACDATLPAGFKTCFRAPGDVACPSGTKTLVGTDTTVTCDSCSCSFPSATCTGKVDFYSSSNCGGGPERTLTDATCDYISENSYGSFKYTGTLKNGQCQAGAAPAGHVALAGVETICCP